MFHSELEMHVRYEELRREADRQRLVREATEVLRAEAGGAGRRSGENEPEGQVSSRPSRRWRVRRAAV
ncbi:hypothetical protein AB0C96_33080 [Streptomyces sp. NPDC048506]|uniref:hypothetical protein n=1 Tax=Streptomyces sp. NPDC048506 TaxID=3155028 RepID=UPI0034343BA4